MNRSLGLGFLAMAVVLAFSTAASAQEISLRGPLANAPSCRHCVQYRTGRFTIAPSIGLSLQDDFQRSIFFGGQIQYHVTDWLGFGLYGAGAVSFDTPLTSKIYDTLSGSFQSNFNTPNIPNAMRFREQLGTIGWMIAPQVTFIPLRGKLALFQNIFADTDFYLFGGFALVGVTERKDFDASTVTGDVQAALQANQIDRVTRLQPTGTLGVGLNFYIVKAFSFSVEYRAYPFSWNTMGTDENTIARVCSVTGVGSCAGSPDYTVFTDAANNAGGRFLINDVDRTFKWNQMINFSFTLYLPFTARVGD